MHFDIQQFMGNSLDEITRKERRNLLLSSSIGIALVTMDVVPSEVSTFGLKFTTDHPATILLLGAGVVGYFWCAFFVCGLSDYLKHYQKTADVYNEGMVALEAMKTELAEKERKLAELTARLSPEDTRTLDSAPSQSTVDKMGGVPKGLRPKLIAARWGLDVIFPLLLGGISIALLVTGWWEAT